VLAGGGWAKILKDRPTTELLLEVQKYVRERIEKRWMPLFLATDAFQVNKFSFCFMSKLCSDCHLLKNDRAFSQRCFYLQRSSGSLRQGFPNFLGHKLPFVILLFLGPQPYAASIFPPNQSGRIIQNDVLLYKADTINATYGVACYCTIYRFSELFLTDKLVSQSSPYMWKVHFIFRFVRAKNAISHMQVVTKGYIILVAFCDSNGYLSSALTRRTELFD